MRNTAPPAACPCGQKRDVRSLSLSECCGPVVDGERLAATCAELMRSRYTAFALGSQEHLARTWHPRTRPGEIELPDVVWTRLRIVDCVGGEPDDEEGVVEFRAYYCDAHGTGVLHERSRFSRRAGRWLYVDGAIDS